jgi:hypothetical protein
MRRSIVLVLSAAVLVLSAAVLDLGLAEVSRKDAKTQREFGARRVHHEGKKSTKTASGE